MMTTFRTAMNALALASGIATCGVATLAPRAAAAEVQKYSVINFPKTARTCQAEADNLGRLIHKRTGVKIYSTQCHQEWADSYYLDVYYIANEPLPEVTTDVYEPNVSSRGIYATYEACWAELEAQKQLFIKATGLKPVLHYCYDDRNSETYHVGLKIVGFGVPKLLPMTFSQSVFGYPTQSMPQIAATIRQNLLSLGVNAYSVTISTGIMESRLTINYYSNGVLPFSLISPWTFDSVALCEAEAPKVASFYSGSGQSVVGAYCARKDLSNAAELNLLTYGLTDSFGFDAVEVGYNDYASCLASRDQAIALYKSQNPERTVTGAICARKDQYSQIYVYVFSL